MAPRWKTEIQQRMEDLHGVYGDLTHGRVTLTKNRHHKKTTHVPEAVIVVSLLGRRTITARKEAKTFEEAIRAGFEAVMIKVRKHHDKRSRTEIRTPPILPCEVSFARWARGCFQHGPGVKGLQATTVNPVPVIEA